MNQAQFDKLIDSCKGRFFSIKFVRKDGKERIANGKDRYQRLVKGGKNTVRQAGYNSFVDRNKETWIAAKGEKVKEFRCGSIVHTFE